MSLATEIGFRKLEMMFTAMEMEFIEEELYVKFIKKN
jgi:hypothetical protein